MMNSSNVSNDTENPGRPEGLDVLGACATLREVRAGRLSAREVLERNLDAIERLNPVVNAVVVLDANGARARADALDAGRAQGRSAGPLHGLPVTLKETFDVAGLPTSWGDPALAGNIAVVDSAIAQRLRNAGAVILGKTNVPERLADWETDNSLYGVTRNPRDPTRSAGGSSGGGAAAVAAGMVSADIGSDQGGSIRIPAHYCGIYGLKPTWNLIPMIGHSLQSDLRNPDIAVAGPLAREPNDLALLLSALAGPDDLEAEGWSLHLPQPDPRALSSYRIAALLDHPDCPIDRSYLEGMQRFLEKLKSLGVIVETDALPDFSFARATVIMNLLVRSETATRLSGQSFRSALSVAREGSLHEGFHRRQNARGTTLLHRDWLLLHEERQHLRKAWARFFSRYDAFLCPVAASAAPPLLTGRGLLERTIDVNGRRIAMLDQHLWTAVASVPYLPSVVMPIGEIGSGLPVGIQIVGPAYHDLRLIALASLIRVELGNP